MTLSVQDIIDDVTDRHDGLVVATNWGERGLFYNPEGILPKDVYLLTFKERDGANDSASHVDRDGVYRLNLGLSKPTFRERFGDIPARPKAGQTISGDWDFTSLNTITPHPVYGWMAWIAVLSPEPETYTTLKPLIQESYEMAKTKYNKRISS